MRFLFALFVLAGCSTAELLSSRELAVVVDPGQVFHVTIADYRTLDQDVLPRLGMLPDGFSVESQDRRSFVLKAPIYPGVYEIPYRFAAERDGVTTIVSEESRIIVTVNDPATEDGVVCDGSVVQLSLSFFHNEAAGTVSTNGFVTGIATSPTTATVRRKNASGVYRPGSLAVTFGEGGFTALGTVSAADFAAYPILEFDVDSSEPSDDWSCSVD